MALNFADPQVKRIIMEDSSKLTLSEVFSTPEFAELLEEAIKFNFLLKEVYTFTFLQNELKIYLPTNISVILTADGILKVPTIDEEYIEITCRADHIFDFLKRANFAHNYPDVSISPEENKKNTLKNLEALDNFNSFRFYTDMKYRWMNPANRA